MQTNGTSTAAASIQAAAVAANNVAIKEATAVAHDAGFTQATTLLYGIEEEDPNYPGYFIKKEGTGIGSPYFGVEDAGDYGTFDTAGEFVFNDLKFNRDFEDLSSSEKKQLVQDYYRAGPNDQNFSQLVGYEEQKYDLEDNAWANDLPYSSIADEIASLDAEIAELELVGAEAVWGSARMISRNSKMHTIQSGTRLTIMPMKIHSTQLYRKVRSISLSHLRPGKSKVLSSQIQIRRRQSAQRHNWMQLLPAL